MLCRDWVTPAFRGLTLSNRMVGLLNSPLLTEGTLCKAPTGALPNAGTGVSALYRAWGLQGRLPPRGEGKGRQDGDTETDEGFRLGVKPSRPPDKGPVLGGGGQETVAKLGTDGARADIYPDHRAPEDGA